MQNKKVNHETRLGIPETMKNDLKEIAEALGFRESDLTRFFIGRAIQQIKCDALKNGGGYQDLEITWRLK